MPQDELPKSITTKVGSITFTIFPFRRTDGKIYWRFKWINPQGKLKDVTRSTQENAIKAARDKAREIQRQETKLQDLTQNQKIIIYRFLEINPSLADMEEFIKWHSNKQKSINLHQLADLYTSDLESRKLSFSYTKKMKNFCKKIKSTYTDKPLQEIKHQEIEEWIQKHHKGRTARTINNVADRWVTIYRWAQLKSYLPQGMVEPQRISKLKERPTTTHTYTPQEGEILIKNADKAYLPWIILCGWGCCRTDEICPEIGSSKDPLRWSDFHWEKGVIIMRPETAKKGKKRVIPINDTITKHLKDIALANPNQKCVTAAKPPYTGKNPEYVRLGKLLPGKKWKRNALRNSSVSYRATQVGLPQTAMEHGNSESECRNSYNDAVLPAEAELWYKS